MRYSNSLSWEVPPLPTTVFSMSFAVYHTHFRSACTWEQSCLALSIFSFSRYHCSFSKWCAEFFSHSGVKIPAPLSSSPKLGLDSRAGFLPLHSFLVFIILCVWSAGVPSWRHFPYRNWSAFHVLADHLCVFCHHYPHPQKR